MLGDLTFLGASATAVVDGIAPTMRTGVALKVANGFPGRILRGTKITLTSNQSSLAFTGGQVRSSSDQTIPGATLTVAAGGKTITLSGIELDEPSFVAIWLDLNEPYVDETTFKAQAIY